MSDCIFCKIVEKSIPSKPVYEDDFVYAFHDISPQTPTHILIIPKSHISSLNDVDDSNCAAIAHIFKMVPKIAKEAGLSENGYRVVSNCGDDAGQTVKHLHFHIMGGKKLQLMMG